jgi:NTE family protein
MQDTKTKVAIACQGGGSQTAFTAGALSHLLRAGVQDEFQIVSLSGASGGAICAALAWAGLRLGEAEPWRRLEAFWRDNTAQGPVETLLNTWGLGALRLSARGALPMVHSSPYSPGFQASMKAAMMGARPEYGDLGKMIARHLDEAELARFDPLASPVLLIGAVDILSGRMREFTSREGPIRVVHLLASAAVPELFRAVDVGDGSLYWDGLFSDNPPTGELIRDDIVGAENIPDEIWVIKINPTVRAREPVAPDEIIDRRNELYGNISLFHQIANIAKLNDLFLADAFKPEFLATSSIKRAIRIPRAFAHKPVMPYHMPCIEMSPALQESLDYESKLDRSPEHLHRLMADGAARAAEFLQTRAQPMTAGPR